MALKRFRAVQMGRSHFAVLDHGDPVDGETTTIGPNQAGAGQEVPVFRQDGDPEDPSTTSRIVWRSGGATAEDAEAAVSKALELNREDDASRPDLLEA